MLYFQKYKYPWIVSLISNASQPYLSAFCAGTLVASRYVVTAASCVGARLPASVLARLGEHDLRRGEAEQMVGVSRVTVHPYHHPCPHIFIRGCYRTNQAPTACWGHGVHDW